MCLFHVPVSHGGGIFNLILTITKITPLKHEYLVLSDLGSACPPLKEKAASMPKEMINVTIQRKQGEPWGMVIVGGKDQALTVKLGRIKAYSPAEAAGLKEWDYIWSINGQEVFEMAHNQICGIIKSAGTSLQMVVERCESLN